MIVKEDGSQFSEQQTFAVTIATSLVIVVSVQVSRNGENSPMAEKMNSMTMMHVSVPRSDLSHTTGQLSITSLYGEV